MRKCRVADCSKGKEARRFFQFYYKAYGPTIDPRLTSVSTSLWPDVPYQYVTDLAFQQEHKVLQTCFRFICVRSTMSYIVTRSSFLVWLVGKHFQWYISRTGQCPHTNSTTRTLIDYDVRKLSQSPGLITYKDRNFSITRITIYLASSDLKVSKRTHVGVEVVCRKANTFPDFDTG